MPTTRCMIGEVLTLPRTWIASRGLTSTILTMARRKASSIWMDARVMIRSTQTILKSSCRHLRGSILIMEAIRGQLLESSIILISLYKVQKGSRISNRWFKDYRAIYMMQILAICYKSKWIVLALEGLGQQMELQNPNISKFLSNNLARTTIQTVHKVRSLTKTSTLVMRIEEQGQKLWRPPKITEACSLSNKPIAWRTLLKSGSARTCSQRSTSHTVVTQGLKVASPRRLPQWTTITLTKIDLGIAGTRTQTTLVEGNNPRRSLVTTVTQWAITRGHPPIRKNNHPTNYCKWMPRRALGINRKTLTILPFSMRKMRLKRTRPEKWHRRKLPREEKREWTKMLISLISSMPAW